MALPNSQNTEHPIGGGGSPSYLGSATGAVGFFADPYGASFIGSISGTTLTVVTLLSGTIQVGQPITTGASTGTIITALGTGLGGSNPTLALGTYTLSISQTVAQGNMTTGGVAVAQPSYLTLGISQAAGLFSSSQAGTITKYQVSVVTNSAAATTTTEQTSRVAGATSNPWTGVLTSSVIWVNAPASTAGLGIAGYRAASSGATSSIAINYINVSNAAINIAAGNYDIIEIQSGPLTTTATLTPVVVPFNTSQEQIFTITGSVCLPGTVAIVNKPTAQTGLGYNPMARVVGPNQVGITFMTVSTGAATTGAGITPTGGETYQFAFLPQLNAFNGIYNYTIPAGQAATNASSVTEATSGCTGTLLTDVVVGVQRATTGTLTSTAVTGGRVTSAGVIGVQYLTVLGAQTPVSSELYNATILRQVPLNPNMLYSAALTGTTCAATSMVEVTTTVTGLLVSTSVAVTKPSVTAGLSVVNARVSAANTLAVTYANMTQATITVPAETYLISNVQLQGPGVGVVSSGVTQGAGQSVSQSYYPGVQQTLLMAQALRAALSPLGVNLISGT